MNEQRTLSRSEVREWLTSRGTLRQGTHSFTKRICHWSYCANCGLVTLKNEATRRAMKAACVWED
jgi:hypothetical protein